MHSYQRLTVDNFKGRDVSGCRSRHLPFRKRHSRETEQVVSRHDLNESFSVQTEHLLAEQMAALLQQLAAWRLMYSL